MSMVTTAEVGTKFTIDGVEYTVGPKCDQNNGRWVCVNDAEVFPNQLAKDLHISDGDHELAWVCIEHGPEVP